MGVSGGSDCAEFKSVMAGVVKVKSGQYASCRRPRAATARPSEALRGHPRPIERPRGSTRPHGPRKAPSPRGSASFRGHRRPQEAHNEAPKGAHEARARYREASARLSEAPRGLARLREAPRGHEKRRRAPRGPRGPTRFRTRLLEAKRGLARPRDARLRDAPQTTRGPARRPPGPTSPERPHDARRSAFEAPRGARRSAREVPRSAHEAPRGPVRLTPQAPRGHSTPCEARARLSEAAPQGLAKHPRNSAGPSRKNPRPSDRPTTRARPLRGPQGRPHVSPEVAIGIVRATARRAETRHTCLEAHDCQEEHSEEPGMGSAMRGAHVMAWPELDEIRPEEFAKTMWFGVAVVVVV